MSAVENLLILYAGLILLNTILAAALWRIHRTELNGRLFYVWAASVLSIVAQAVSGANDLTVVLGFSLVWLVNLALARLIGSIADLKVSRTRAAAVMGLGYAISVGAFLADSDFTVVALPVCLAVTYPLVDISVRSVANHWATLTFSARALIVCSLMFAAHNIDFAFLRDQEDFAALGFTVAIAIIFGLSIFAPAVVLEVVTDQQSRVAAEMDVAHRIQMMILPKDPEIPGLELACYMNPAEDVGGDYYDIYSFGNHHWILLGDVTGHGLRSGLVMLMAQSILSAILHTRTDVAPGELAFLANTILYKNLQRLNELRSMTIVAICREGEGERFVYSGSHDNIYVYRKQTGEVEVIEVIQLPHGLGFLDEFGLDEFTESTFDLNPGDMLFIASDGIVEAARHGDYERGLFEQDRLVQLLTEFGEEPLPALKGRILGALEDFTGGVFHDDVTFVIARVQA